MSDPITPEKPDLKKTTEQFLAILKDVAPDLYTIHVINTKFIKEMDIDYGEIHITEYIKDGKIYRVEASPVVSKLINT